MQTLRLADPATASAYPLPVTGAVEWYPHDGGFAVDIDLPALPPGTLVVPSLALPDQPPAYHRWALHTDSAVWMLPVVPSSAAPAAPPAQDPRVSLHIDCWHVHGMLALPTLHLYVHAERPPVRYLVTVSARPLELAIPPVPQAAHGLAHPPPQISQMAAPADIANSICSPTGLAMVLGHWGATDPWLEIVGECRDPATGMYGVWPLAIAAAARRGSIGAVEVFSNWDEPLQVLARGIPIVTSIRFESGGLPGAPLERTGGHLVVLFSAGPDTVGVNDPAAPDAGSVARTYSAAAFSAAWLGYRGAAYILPP